MHEKIYSAAGWNAQAMTLNKHRHIMLCFTTQAVAAAADSLLCNEQDPALIDSVRPIGGKRA